MTARATNKVLSNGTKYSPNLARWIARQQRSTLGELKVFRDLDGVRWIGWVDDEHWFIGCRLMRCLSMGAKAETGAFAQKLGELTPEPDFWDRYNAIGRCAIDEAHAISFIGDEGRWSVDGDTRHCLWCGRHTQHLDRWTETTEHTCWTNAEPEDQA